MNTRQLLIKETEKQISERGIGAVSVRSVTSNIHHNVATISYYFRTKDNLFLTILKENLVELVNHISTENENPGEKDGIKDVYTLIEYVRLNPVSASAISQITKHVVNNYTMETRTELSAYICSLFKSKLPEFESDIFPKSFRMLENLSLISEILSFTLCDHNVATTELSELETLELSQATYQIYKIKRNNLIESPCAI